MHNRSLADRLNVSVENREKIDELHEEIEKLISRASLGVFHQSVYDKIEELEFKLQTLWGFDVNAAYHTHKHHYAFKAKWRGKQFRCKKTGEVFTIPDTVEEGSFYSWGEAFVDIGRYNCYHRMSACEIVEVKEIKE